LEIRLGHKFKKRLVALDTKDSEDLNAQLRCRFIDGSATIKDLPMVYL
jgi:hypothetical protein